MLVVCSLILYTIKLLFHTFLYTMTRIGRSKSHAGNDWPDPYLGLSCVIGWVQPYCVEYFYKATVPQLPLHYDSYWPQQISCWKWLARSLFRTKLCHRMGSTILCRIFLFWPWGTIFWEILCGGMFRYYLPGSYKFNHVIAITETECDTGYLEIRCLTGLFDIIFDTVGLCLL